MNFKSIILAATGLLALIGATATVNKEDKMATSSLSLTNIEVRVDDSFDIAHAPPSQCYLNCHLPWEKCQKECGGTEQCGHLCHCQLFSNPKQICRARNCVEGPDNCPGRKLEGVEQLHETAVEARADGEEDVQTAWSPTFCEVCQLARDTCKQNCATAGACDDACDCYHNLKNLNCKNCKIPCACGHTCPRLEPIQRRVAVDEATMVGEAHPRSIVSIRAEDDVQTAGIAPAPVPCVLCVVARNICKKKCATPGACDDACDCYNKFKNRNCKDCKIPCGCGHTCPRLEPLQSRMAIDEAREIESTRSGSVASNSPEQDAQTADPPARPPPPCLNCQPPPVPCTLCQISLNTCKLHCATPGTCNDSCNCWHKHHNPNCKGCSNIPCRCKTSCSRLDPLQRRMEVNDNLKSPHDPPSNSSDQSDPGAIEGPGSALSVPSPIGACNQCTLSVGNCQNNCATPGACDDACYCYFLKSKACKKCGFPCKCGHTCPRLALLQRREITELPTTKDIKHSETVPDTGALGVPNPCVVCQTGIQACKNKCDGDSKCENDCDCDHKNFTPQCKECSIPCNSLAPRQDELSDAKGEDVTSTTNDETPEQLGEFLPPLDDCMRFAWDCRKACPTPGACDDACNCYYRRKPMCHQWGHKLPCDCGHTCPRLAPAQRRDDM